MLKEDKVVNLTMTDGDGSLLNLYSTISKSEHEFVIDADLRNITVPVGPLGVEGDHRVCECVFVCPKIYNNTIDLAQFTPTIHYLNAAGQVGIAAVENLTVVDDSTIEFSWWLSRAVTAQAGTVQFNVCFRKMSGAEVEREYNTRRFSFTILPGLTVDEITPESPIVTDLLQQWKDEIDETKADKAYVDESVEKTLNDNVLWCGDYDDV